MSVLLRTKHDSAMKIRPVKLRKQPPALTTMRKDRTMADKPDITPELLRQLLRYEPETGKLFWKARDVKYFDDERSWRSWNTRYAGKEAFKAANKHIGYRASCVLRARFYAHRVAWAIYYGVMPLKEIDHINGTRSDNRISNLREVSRAENARNMTISRRNKSGTTGVHFTKREQKWMASAWVEGKVMFLGYFDQQEGAQKARQEANMKFGFHQGHGKPR